jgi:putative aldouronate transport system permease protein
MTIQEIITDFKRHKYVYLLFLPVLAFFFIFHYVPMYGVTIAFKQFTPRGGIIGSPWVGIEHFRNFFTSYYFVRLIRNTITISISDILWGFPAPIILALLINELKGGRLKKTIQTLTYLPHFISLVVVCGIIIDFTSSTGVANDVIAFFGFERVSMLSRPEFFRPVYISTNIWQQVGWGSIIYLAALSTIDPALYEAATIDGANRWRRTWAITIPSIMPTIIILLILRLGNIMNVGFEKIILLYNPITYETADVISTFVYRKGLMEFDYSYAAAIGLFNSVINFALLVLANRISRRISETSLW